MWFFSKIAEGSKFTVKCNWYIKTSESVQKMDSFWKKKTVFSKKK